MDKNDAKKILQDGHQNFINKNYSAAREQWLKLLKIDPKNLSLLNGISLTYYYENKLEETEKFLRKIVDINLSEPKALSMLILILEQQDKISEAKKFIKLGLSKKVLDKHWEILMQTMSPIIKLSNDEIKKTRIEIEKNIEATISNPNNYNFNIDNHLIKPLQFSLSYDQFDNLELNKKCIKFYKKIYPELNKVNNINKVSSSKIKIGFISEYLTDHTIGKLFKGIILRLDQNKFDVIVFHTEKTKNGSILKQLKDAEQSGMIKNYFLPNSFSEKQKIILKEKLDILFYPEIGLSLQLYYLSFIRLAKIQMTSWGHPETTSNSSIDYFLTSKLIEEKNSQKNFSERLLYLDYLPMYYYIPLVNNKINKELLSQNNIYSCPQTLQKIHPEFDLVIAGILKKDKKAKINFIKDQNNVLYKKLISRFQKNKEIDLERVNFLDGLSWEQYINHCGQSSVLLDPIYYGAGNSFYESVFYGTPTITMPTNYTKSRLVLGAYNQIDITEINFNPIVSSIDSYVSKAVETSNKKNLFDLKQNIQAQAKKNLYENNLVISNFEEVIKKIVI